MKLFLARVCGRQWRRFGPLSAVQPYGEDGRRGNKKNVGGREAAAKAVDHQDVLQPRSRRRSRAPRPNQLTLAHHLGDIDNQEMEEKVEFGGLKNI